MEHACFGNKLSDLGGFGIYSLGLLGWESDALLEHPEKEVVRAFVHGAPLLQNLTHWRTEVL